MFTTLEQYVERNNSIGKQFRAKTPVLETMLRKQLAIKPLGNGERTYAQKSNGVVGTMSNMLDVKIKKLLDADKAKIEQSYIQIEDILYKRLLRALPIPEDVRKVFFVLAYGDGVRLFLPSTVVRFIEMRAEFPTGWDHQRHFLTYAGVKFESVLAAWLQKCIHQIDDVGRDWEQVLSSILLGGGADDVDREIKKQVRILNDVELPE